MQDTREKSLPQLCKDQDDCCGCSACYAICPVEAITMVPDRKGFPYPMVDEEKCIRCYKCLEVCRFKKDRKRE